MGCGKFRDRTPNNPMATDPGNPVHSEMQLLALTISVTIHDATIRASFFEIIGVFSTAQVQLLAHAVGRRFTIFARFLKSCIDTFTIPVVKNHALLACTANLSKLILLIA